jgi:hypothetical protein
LTDTLLAGVPVAAADRSGPPAVPQRSRALRYVGVAAAITIAASVVVQRLAAPSGPPRIVADINDRSGTRALIDHNSARPTDINVCDNDALP